MPSIAASQPSWPTGGQYLFNRKRLAVRGRSLGLSMALGCGGLLLIAGDFSPYVGEPDRDVYIATPGPVARMLASTALATLIGVVSSCMFTWTDGLAHDFTRTFTIATAGFTLLIYVYGPFKTVLGNGSVFYELPWGPERWMIAAGCGGALAGATTAAACVFGGRKR